MGECRVCKPGKQNTAGISSQEGFTTSKVPPNSPLILKTLFDYLIWYDENIKDNENQMRFKPLVG